MKTTFYHLEIPLFLLKVDLEMFRTLFDPTVDSNPLHFGNKQVNYELQSWGDFCGKYKMKSVVTL